MSSQTILSVNNLSVSFTTNDGIVDAVKNVGFELQAGENAVYRRRIWFG